MLDLKIFRKSMNKTPAEMAELMKISVHTYYKTEEGSRQPTYGFIKKFKEVFKVNVDEMFF